MEPVTLIVTGRSVDQSPLLYHRSAGRMRNGKRRPTPKSAPPGLLRRRAAQAHFRAGSSKDMRATSAHSAAQRRPARPPSAKLSISDVYKMAETTRMRMSRDSRQLVVEETQKLVRNDSGMSRPLTAVSSASFSQGGWRKTNSSEMSGRRVELESEGEENGDVADDTSTAAFSANASALSRKPRSSSANRANSSSAIGSRPSNSRLGSALTTGSELLTCVSPRPAESEARKMSVSRQCCEVMGPGVCRDCQKLRMRMMDRERMEADFPRLRISEKNVTTSAVLMRIFPEMTQAEIQDKIARGEINKSGLLFPPHRSHPSDGSDEEDDSDFNFKLRSHGLPGQGQDDDEKTSSRGNPSRTNSSLKNRKDGPDSAKTPNSLVVLTKLKLSLAGEASTPLFFMDLRHMNSKIFHGRVGKNLKPPKVVEEHSRREKGLLSIDTDLSSAPCFISPRKSKLVEEPSYKVFFQPPLLAKHRQVSNPCFFAGSDNPYHLPERLPDVIEFADGKTSLTDPNTLTVRSESSMSFVSAVSEDSPELSGRNEAVRTNIVLHETVHE